MSIIQEKLLNHYQSNLNKLQNLESSYNKNYSHLLEEYKKHKLLIINLHNMLPKTNDKYIKQLIFKNIRLQNKILNKLQKLINKKQLKQNGGNNDKKILVKTNDNVNVYISGKILQESQLIKNILEDLGESYDPIPLPKISEKILNIIDNNIETKDLNTLIQIANAANYLAMDNYLDNITTQISLVLREQFK